MRNAYDVKETEKGFVVKIYDNGFTTMSDLINGEWKICYFPTREEAEKAMNNYNEFWKGAE